ncbi:hypothetical protein GCM10012287_24270 [Streptomyces daqingensis]|uniref:Response regulatory domain-containing protein n=1 Tax=Streptomyces daqingensis TaxID=1472640 RepID=A0ABQ2MAH1_9ACTN|nr:hypothetical protein GCM10012287_24270 [Streptomyces daqingensis]
MADAGSIRVLTADDQMTVREGLSVLLGSRPGFEVAGEAADRREAVEAVLALRPDVALPDVRMPVMSGLEATREIVRVPPPPRC